MPVPDSEAPCSPGALWAESATQSYTGRGCSVYRLRLGRDVLGASTSVTNNYEGILRSLRFKDEMNGKS